VILLLSGRKLGNPLAGWLATIMVAASFVVTVVVFAGLFRLPAGGRSYTQTGSPGSQLSPARQHGPSRRPLSMTMAGVRDRCERPHPLYSIGYMEHDEDFPKFFLYLNLFVRRCCCSYSRTTSCSSSSGGKASASARTSHRFLVRTRHSLERRQEGDDLQPHRGRRVLVALFLIYERTGARLPHGLLPPRQRREPSLVAMAFCCSPAPSASRPRSRFIHGLPTRWKARLRSRRSSTPRRW